MTSIPTVTSNNNVSASVGDTGPVFSCIPDLATYVPPSQIDLIDVIKCCQPTGNQIYSSLYATGQIANYLVGQAAPNAESQFEWWFGRFAFFLVLPWVLILISFFIYLMVAGTISLAAGLAFISVTVIIAILSLAWILWDVSNTATNIYNSFITDFNNARNAFPDDIYGHIVNAYLLEESCNPNEDNVCCGFDYTSCINGCLLTLEVDPELVLAGSTGRMEVDLTNGSAEMFTSGTITVPGELNGGTAINVSVPPDGFTGFVFTYNASNSPQTVLITATLNPTGGGDQIEISTPVTIIGDSISLNLATIRNMNTKSRKKSSCSSCRKA